MRRRTYAALTLTLAALASTPALAQHVRIEIERTETRTDARQAHDQPNLEEMIGGLRAAIGVIREHGHERAEAEFSKALQRLVGNERERAEFRRKLRQLEERAADLAAAGRREAVQDVTNEMRRVAQRYERTGERNLDRARDLLAEAHGYLTRFEPDPPRAHEQRPHDEGHAETGHAAPPHTPPPHAEAPHDALAGHVRQAVEHLMAAGMPDLAELIEREGAPVMHHREVAPDGHGRHEPPRCEACARGHQPQRAHDPQPKPPHAECPHQPDGHAHKSHGNHAGHDEACGRADDELAGKLDELTQRVARLAREVARLSRLSRERD